MQPVENESRKRRLSSIWLIVWILMPSYLMYKKTVAHQYGFYFSFAVKHSCMKYTVLYVKNGEIEAVNHMLFSFAISLLRATLSILYVRKFQRGSSPIPLSSACASSVTEASFFESVSCSSSRRSRAWRRRVPAADSRPINLVRP